ncbi:hypothetical protein DPMN_170014 [Dreissena polymorpha]|uniref:Uncharacterized protein n=1 Tax=Dreissena polymorpha TaxID=45954 RepID=A0A9D4IE72_DREPO|nr:hypothetical protein DPMN_170014 [Dreissena polymorpha]
MTDRQAQNNIPPITRSRGIKKSILCPPNYMEVTSSIPTEGVFLKSLPLTKSTGSTQ